MYKDIRDYGIIGNLRSAALVGLDGSVDWAPAPYMDSPSVFAAILDDKKGGHWSIAPVAEHESNQHYIAETNILVTEFQAQDAVITLTDYIPAKGGQGKKQSDLQEIQEKAEIHRKVTCTKGSCEVKMECMPKFDYARGETKLTHVPEGILAEHEKGGLGVLVSKQQIEIQDNKAISVFTLKQGESAYFAFHYHNVVAEELKDEHYEREIEETKAFWKNWVSRCDLDSCLIQYPRR